MWKCLAQLLAIEQVLPVGQKVKQLPPQMERRQKSSGMEMGAEKNATKKHPEESAAALTCLRTELIAENHNFIYFNLDIWVG